MQFVAKLPKTNLDMLKAGVSLTKRTNYTLDRLCQKAVADRVALAALLLREAKTAASLERPSHRTIISRSYYAMYHAMRAVVYRSHGGDDFERHTELPKHIPSDFPNRSSWENELKNARLRRNEADYDPYPTGSSAFKNTAEQLLPTATHLLAEVRRYLRTKASP